MRREGPAVAALYLLITFIWGSTWLVVKIGLDGVPPLLGAGLRFLLGAAVLFVVVALRRAPVALTRDDKIAIASCGLLSFTASYAGVYWAEQRISSGLTALLFSTMPLSVALLSRFWTGDESLEGRKIAGILLGIAGTAVLFGPRDAAASGAMLGMACALGSSVAAAVNLVTMRRHSRGSDIYVLNAFGMAIGAAALLLMSALFESYAGLRWTRANVLAILYLSLIGSVIAFLAYYHLVKVMRATTLSTITLLFPIIAVALGRAFLSEPVPAGMALGMSIVLAGVALVVAPAD